jgi:hypothetical protein
MSAADPFSILNRDPERGIMKPQPIKPKVNRYRAGQAPEISNADDDDDDDIFPGAKTITHFSETHSVLQDNKSLSKSVASENPKPIERRRKIHESEIVEEDNKLRHSEEEVNKIQKDEEPPRRPINVEKSYEKADIEVLNTEEAVSRRERIRARLLKKDTSEEQPASKKIEKDSKIVEESVASKAPEPKATSSKLANPLELMEESEEENDENEEDENAEEDYEDTNHVPLLKPVFVSRAERENHDKRLV